jgi:tetratricopeptide (TPR) repeat protein
MASPLCADGTERFHSFSFLTRVLSFTAAALLLSHSQPLSAQRDSMSSLREKIDQAERERMDICKILGAIYEEIGDTDKAIESYRMGFQVYPDDPFLCTKLIRLYTLKEAWADLVPVYESLVNVNPGANQKYMNDLTECLLKVGRPEEALKVTRDMLEDYGDDAAIYRDAAHLFMKYDQHQGAASICRLGIEGEFADNHELHWVLGRALGKLKDYAEAVSAYQRAIELCSLPRDRDIIEKELAELCAEEPVIDQILEQKIESLDAVDQRLAELYWQLALDKENAGHLEEALVLYRKIPLLVPDSDRRKAAEAKIQKLSNP